MTRHYYRLANAFRSYAVFLTAVVVWSMICNPAGFSRSIKFDDIKNLNKLLNNQNKEMRIRSLMALGKKGSAAAAAVPNIVKLLEDKEAEVRKEAANALFDIQGTNALPSLRKMLMTETEPRVLFYIVTVIQSMGPKAEAAIPALIHAMQIEDKSYNDVSMSAWIMLIRLGSANVPFLLAIVENLENLREKRIFKYYDVNMTAWVALINLGSASVPDLVTLAENQRTKHINRCMALDALVAIGAQSKIGTQSKSAVPRLSKLLSDKDKDIVDRVAIVLGSIGLGAKAALPQLKLVATKAPTTQLRLDAARSMHQIDAGNRITIATIQDILQRGSSHERSSAASLAWEIGPPARAVIPSLIEILKDVRPSTRSSAAHALGAMGISATSAIPALREAVKDENARVRKEAMDALRRIERESEP